MQLELLRVKMGLGTQSQNNISMNAFVRLYTDLIANDCRVFDWLGALNKK